MQAVDVAVLAGWEPVRDLLRSSPNAQIFRMRLRNYRGCVDRGAKGPGEAGVWAKEIYNALLDDARAIVE